MEKNNVKLAKYQILEYNCIPDATTLGKNGESYISRLYDADTPKSTEKIMVATNLEHG